MYFTTELRKKEESWVTYLSEAYEDFSGEANLELKVLTLNVNEGHNRKLMEECHILREYAQYVAKVRKYTKEMNLDGAVELAVDECIQEGIFVEFLRKNKSEVVAMSIFEYNQEEEERKWKESVYEAARAGRKSEGRKSGRKSRRKSRRKITGKKEIVQSLAERGMNLGDIAEIIKVSQKTIQEWLDQK